jgi:hypothetical protein
VVTDRQLQGFKRYIETTPKAELGFVNLSAARQHGFSAHRRAEGAYDAKPLRRPISMADFDPGGAFDAEANEKMLRLEGLQKFVHDKLSASDRKTFDEMLGSLMDGPEDDSEANKAKDDTNPETGAVRSGSSLAGDSHPHRHGQPMPGNTGGVGGRFYRSPRPSAQAEQAFRKMFPEAKDLRRG